MFCAVVAGAVPVRRRPDIPAIKGVRCAGVVKRRRAA